MAGYSGTPLPQKLGIKPGSRVALVDPPPDFAATLGALLNDVALIDGSDGSLDVVVCFVTEPAELESRMRDLKPRLAWNGGLWVGWPKRAARVASTLGESAVREIGLAAGLVDNKVCAIDETWSGLRFVWRLEDRPHTARARRASK